MAGGFLVYTWNYIYSIYLETEIHQVVMDNFKITLIILDVGLYIATALVYLNYLMFRKRSFSILIHSSISMILVGVSTSAFVAYIFSNIFSYEKVTWFAKFIVILLVNFPVFILYFIAAICIELNIIKNKAIQE
jgi:hypothetical protein